MGHGDLGRDTLILRKARILYDQRTTLGEQDNESMARVQARYHGGHFQRGEGLVLVTQYSAALLSKSPCGQIHEVCNDHKCCQLGLIRFERS